jgi:hypothetical protein
MDIYFDKDVIVTLTISKEEAKEPEYIIKIRRINKENGTAINPLGYWLGSNMLIYKLKK